MRSPMPEPYEREERPEFREVPRPVREAGYYRDIVRWGPIIGGTFAAISILVVMTVLGLLIGLATVGPGGAVTGTNVTIWAIWGAISMIVALFFGGWLAARTSVFGGTFSGIIDGSLVWATTLLIALFLTGFGASAVLGALLGQLGTPGAPGAIAPPGAAIDVTASALWTFIGLIVSYGAAVAGGLFGTSQEEVSPRS